MILKLVGQISGFVLSILLVLIIVVAAMQHMTAYDAMSSMVDKAAREQKMAPGDFNESDFPAVKQDMLDTCSASEDGLTTVSLEDNKTATLNCTDVQATKDSKDLFALLAVSGFNEMYYKKYDCSFISCLASDASFMDKLSMIVSEKAHKFYGDSFWFVVAAAVITGLIYIFSIGDLLHAARSIGWTFAIIGSGFIFSLIFKDKGITTGAGEAGTTVTLPVIANVLSLIQTYFIAYFIVGIILLAIGYIGSFVKSKNSKNNKK